ncbi:MAG: DUF262 domain-containing protein, partial [Pseudomonadota bacterium]
MSDSNFKTNNLTFRELIGNGMTYSVPPFQRDYSWEIENWEALWDDIIDSFKNNDKHYLGYLVLREIDEKTKQIIDGQQRISTLIFIALAAMNNLKKLSESGINSEKNNARFNSIKTTYIGDTDLTTLIEKPHLILNYNNDFYFRDQIIPLKPLSKNRLKESEKRIAEGFKWFDKMVAEYIKDIAGDKGDAIATLIDKINRLMFFTVIEVSDELNAYK